MSQEKDQTGFLSRWSQRKLNPSEEAELEVEAAAVEQSEESADTAPATDEQTPIWQRDDVDEDTKKAALRSLFKKPEFHVRDGLNEYDDDFTKFASLGNVVTHEMKRMLKLAEEKTRPDSSQPESTQSADAEVEQPRNDNEDTDLA
jgi:hypothetical protein